MIVSFLAFLPLLEDKQSLMTSDIKSYIVMWFNFSKYYAINSHSFKLAQGLSASTKIVSFILLYY